MFGDVFAGEDSNGNKYYQTKKGKRLIRYASSPDDPSLIAPEWYAWLHYMSDKPVSKNKKLFAWEKERKANATGTSDAYYPEGHLLRNPKKITEEWSYHVWKP